MKVNVIIDDPDEARTLVVEDGEILAQAGVQFHDHVNHRSCIVTSYEYNMFGTGRYRYKIELLVKAKPQPYGNVL